MTRQQSGKGAGSGKSAPGPRPKGKPTPPDPSPKPQGQGSGRAGGTRRGTSPPTTSPPPAPKTEPTPAPRPRLGDPEKVAVVEDRRFTLLRTIGGRAGEERGKNVTWEARGVDGDPGPYFVKRFSKPKFPSEADEKDDPEYSSGLRAMCDEFESRHREVMRRIHEARLGSGGLVKPMYFGRDGDTLQFAKVYPMLANVNVLTPKIAAEWSPLARLRFLRSLFLALHELHSVGVVHGDIKPENVLVADLEGVGPLARLIDFDDAYFTGNPPPPEQLEGITIVTPEARKYVDPEQYPQVPVMPLTTASDLFQLAVTLRSTFAVQGKGRRSRSIRSDESGDEAELSLTGTPSEYFDLRCGGPFESERISDALHRCLRRTPADRPSITDLLIHSGVICS